jgi:hypothetical protein
MKPGTEWKEGSRKGRKREDGKQNKVNETRDRVEMRAAGKAGCHSFCLFFLIL